MKKSTMLIAALIVLIVGGLFYQFVLHPNPYNGVSRGEAVGLTDGQ